jgi:hypothetical protein
MPDVGMQDPDQDQEQQPSFVNMDVVKGSLLQEPVTATDAPGPAQGDANNPFLNPLSEPYQHGYRDGQGHVSKYCYASPLDEENYEAGYAAGESSGTTPTPDQPAPGPAVTAGVPDGGVPLEQIEEAQCRTAEWAAGHDGQRAHLPCSTEGHVHETHPNPEEEEESFDRIRDPEKGEHGSYVEQVDDVPEMPVLE